MPRGASTGSGSRPTRSQCRVRGLALPGGTARSPRAAWEAGQLAGVLARHQGNRRAAAEELGVSERTIYRKIREYGLD